MSMNFIEKKENMQKAENDFCRSAKWCKIKELPAAYNEFGTRTEISQPGLESQEIGIHPIIIGIADSDQVGRAVVEPKWI